MKTNQTYLSVLLSLIFLFPAVSLFATHNRAGEILVEHIGCEEDGNPNTVKISVVTYTNTLNTDVDRDSLLLDLAGFAELYAVRQNGQGSPPQGELVENGVKKNIYCLTYTFPGPGFYKITMLDRNRNAGIDNINGGASVNIPFFLQTNFQLVNTAFQGCNSTPVLNQPPIDFACVGEIYTHNPVAVDPDGDSLSYHFTLPLQGLDSAVGNYVFPNEVAGFDEILTIDELTGDIVWDAPVLEGEYNLAFYIVEYRNGIPIDTILRDMQIFVEDCENDPPTVEVEQDEYCVVAGELLTFDVIAGAPVTDTDQLVRLTAVGAPLDLAISPATFTPEDDSFQDDPLIKTFSWQTTCEHIEDQYYTVVFRAVDNFAIAPGSTGGLATLKSVRIRVVGPPPEDVRIENVSSSNISISWELPYVCEDAADDYFRGFSVWRRIGSNQFPIDTCITGLEGRGYTRISGNLPINDTQNGRYFFQDNNVDRGRTYCYRVLAEFARRTTTGFFYNAVSSLPSNEACAQLGRDIPLLTNVDVQQTDFNDGLMEICWSKPDALDLDTIANPGPYRYELLRAAGQTIESEDFLDVIADFTSETFAEANDTCYVDNLLNTLASPYSYLLRFYARDELIGEANAATSIFLTISPTDEANELSWIEEVPWDNFRYTVYRKDPGATDFNVVGETNDPFYRDEGLINGESYCYYIRSTGTYGVDGLRDPLFNRSQESCAEPFDNVPPCPPELSVESVCDQNIDCSNQSELANIVNWLNPNDICEDTDDVQGFRVYYAPFVESDFELITDINDISSLSYDHSPSEGIAGCYAVTAIDENGNESEFSNIVCVDNCPFYDLPNAFTPNGDTQNDLYVPFDYCFIDRVQFEVYNRWGQIVFRTQDPDLNWDGTNLRGEELADGTYFYRCWVFERRVAGISLASTTLSGYIELFRGRQ